MNSQALIDRELLKELASFCSDSRSYNEAMRVLEATPTPIPDTGELERLVTEQVKHAYYERKTITEAVGEIVSALHASAMVVPKCKCSMSISLLGDGCRYCQPQEYIDRIHDQMEDERAMVAPDGLALMPRALTAENGAKAAMLGEFVIRLERHCSSCADEAGDLSCDECGGDVEYVESVPVDWPTIKDIYAKAVDLLAASPAPGDGK